MLGERVNLTVGSGLYRLRLGADDPFCLLILEREKPAPRENNGSTLAMLPVLMWRSVKNRSSGARWPGWCFPRSALKCRTCWRRSNRWADATAAALYLTGVICRRVNRGSMR